MAMLGASCSPCCGDNCPEDGKPRADPKDEGTWLPSGSWPSVTWTFQANPGDESGETWFFYGSGPTSKKGGGASAAERTDWGNLCNWYSHKTTAPSSLTDLSHISKRATRLPPANAIVHIYTDVSTASNGPVTVKAAYFWNAQFLASSVITATGTAYGTSFGSYFTSTDSVFRTQNQGTVNGGATFYDRGSNPGTVNGGGRFFDEAQSSGTVSGGATFTESAHNTGTVEGGATFNGTASCGNFGVVNGGASFSTSAKNETTVNGGAVFNDVSPNRGTVNNGAVFRNGSFNAAFVNGGATFNDSTSNTFEVNGGATFNNSAGNSADVYGGAVFNGNSFNNTRVRGGAVFNGSSRNGRSATVFGGATFNDAACSLRVTGTYSSNPAICTQKFVAHPTDLPTCNGSAPPGCGAGDVSCGCG